MREVLNAEASPKAGGLTGIHCLKQRIIEPESDRNQQQKDCPSAEGINGKGAVRKKAEIQ